MLAWALFMAAQATPVASVVPPPAPPPSNQATAGNLGVIQLWTDNPEEFMAAWNQPTPPRLSTTTKTKRNNPISTLIIFSGCKGDAAGNCNLKGSIKILDPDGDVYSEHNNVEFFSGPAMEGHNLRLSPSGLVLTIEDGEKLGAYTAQISMTDHNANVTVVTEEKLTISEADPQSGKN